MHQTDSGERVEGGGWVGKEKSESNLWHFRYAHRLGITQQPCQRAATAVKARARLASHSCISCMQAEDAGRQLHLRWSWSRIPAIMGRRCLSCSSLNKGISMSVLSRWKYSMGTEPPPTHTHSLNAVSLWCANSHDYYITGLLLPGLTPLTIPCTLCCTWAINTLHPRRGWSKIPLQSIIHWETHRKREGRTGSAAQE